TRTIDASAITASKQSAGNNESVLGCSRPSSNTSIDLRHASSCDELISPRYNTWRCTTRPPATRLFSTMLKKRCSLPSFFRVEQRRNISPIDYPHSEQLEQGVGLHYKPFRLFRLIPSLAIQPLARAIFFYLASNPRSRAKKREELRSSAQRRQAM